MATTSLKSKRCASRIPCSYIKLCHFQRERCIQIFGDFWGPEEKLRHKKKRNTFQRQLWNSAAFSRGRSTSPVMTNCPVGAATGACVATLNINNAEAKQRNLICKLETSIETATETSISAGKCLVYNGVGAPGKTGDLEGSCMRGSDPK